MDRRAGIVDTVGNLFDFQRNRTGKSIALFAVSFLFLGSLVNAFYSLISSTVKLGVGDAWSGLLAPLLEVLVTTVFCVFVWWIMKRHLQSLVPVQKTVVFESPAKHQGLILLLSPYFHRNVSKFGGYERIYLENLTEARAELLKSNWGPLVVAVEHHCPQLKHCWVICTRGDNGSAKQYEKAVEIIKKMAEQRNSKVECHKQEITNLNDMDEIIKTMEQIYDQALKLQSLPPDRIIADFTGGTAAMSGGVILNAVLKNRELEYMSQDPSKSPLKEDGSVMTPEEIEAKGTLIRIAVTSNLLPKQVAENG